MDGVLDQLKSRRFQSGVDQAGLGLLSPQSWAEEVDSFLLKPESFVAGFISTRVELFRRYFLSAGPFTSAAKQVLKWLAHGLTIEWTAVDSPSQQFHPRYKKRLQIVKGMLRSAVGPTRAVQLLQGSEPGVIC